MGHKMRRETALPLFLGVLGVGDGKAASRCGLSRYRNEMTEYGLGKQIVFPANFRMPLKAEDELAGTAVHDGLYYSIGRPSNWLQITAGAIDRLVMVTVDGGCGPAGK